MASAKTEIQVRPFLQHDTRKTVTLKIIREHMEAIKRQFEYLDSLKGGRFNDSTRDSIEQWLEETTQR